MKGGGSERGRHRIGNRLQALSCQHRARAGLELTDREIMTWAEVGCLTDWATQAPLGETILFYFLFKKKIFLTFIYFWDRERQSMNEGGSERGRHRIWNRLQALSCQHRARAGLELTDREIMTWAEVGRSTDWATQSAPDISLVAFSSWVKLLNGIPIPDNEDISSRRLP